MAQALVRTEFDRKRLIDLIGKAKLPLSVRWESGRARSIDQNALQWKWAQEVAVQLGDTDAADVQARWKLVHGVPILREDDDFREVYDARIKPLPYEAKIAMMRLGFPVSRMMKVGQMTRYLDAIQRECAEQGWWITIPEEAA
ncbi:MAG: hypothetical protein D6811_10180 [Alphaproteobacteria bacterium]|nr:MAG: hypothetical protein D6811_10180 [Alphaproteobacteria bacterium]